ncbi:helix-turn-helix domain-containing protein, partial [Bifidobacterium longum]
MGGRSHHRQPQQKRHRHARRAHHQVHDPAAPARRARRRTDKPKTLHPRYLSQEERIQIADRLRLGDSIRAIARLLGRDPGTVSREVERNRNPESGGYEPYRAQQKAADRLKRPKPRKAAE